ncbi:putative integral inner membrane protein [Bacillus freudenreichii]|nr:putative integral inner membrane protein [Bacillus freudenreichii]
MGVVYWSIVIILIVLAFIGLVYPIIPSVLLLVCAFLLYGFFYTFEPLSFLFWTVQILFVLLIFAADYLVNLYGVKKFGGSKAGIWGSTLGLLIGPFVIPVAGILIGPFLGAVAGELLVNRTAFKPAIKIGVGSVLAFVGSVATKAVIQLFMVGYFLFLVLK